MSGSFELGCGRWSCYSLQNIGRLSVLSLQPEIQSTAFVNHSLEGGVLSRHSVIAVTSSVHV